MKKRIEDSDLGRLEKKVMFFLNSGKWEISKPVYVRSPFFGMPRFSCEVTRLETTSTVGGLDGA